MRQYRLLSGLWRAPLFSKPFYADVATQWRGIGLWYLVILLALSWACVLSRDTLAVAHYLQFGAPVDLKDVPPITITAGVASSPVAQPHTIFSEGGRPVAVLDTTGANTQPADVGAPFLITRTEYIQDDRRGKSEHHSLAGIPNGLYDQAWMLEWIRTFRNWLLPIGLPVLTALWLAGYLLMTLLYALIGLAANSGFHGRLTFAALFRIASVSSTAAIILDTVFSLLGAPYQGWLWLLLRALTLAYVLFGVKAAADVTRPVRAFPVQFAGPGDDSGTGADSQPAPPYDPSSLFP